MKKNNAFHICQHIKHKREFNQIFKKSFRIYGNFFIFRIVPSDKEYSKLGIIIPKRFGNAVYRNHVKRIIREEFRKSCFAYPIKIIINQSKKINNYQQIRHIIVNTFDKLSDKYLLKRCLLSDIIALQDMNHSHALSWMAKISFEFVCFYRKFISAHVTAACRFTPSCSIYALDALRIHGFWHGVILIIKRLLSCHPKGKSGLDPVPLNFEWRKIFK